MSDLERGNGFSRRKLLAGAIVAAASAAAPLPKLAYARTGRSLSGAQKAALARLSDALRTVSVNGLGADAADRVVAALERRCATDPDFGTRAAATLDGLQSLPGKARFSHLDPRAALNFARSTQNPRHPGPLFTSGDEIERSTQEGRDRIRANSAATEPRRAPNDVFFAGEDEKWRAFDFDSWRDGPSHKERTRASAVTAAIDLVDEALPLERGYYTTVGI